MEEIWKNVKDYEGYYEISNLGNVRSLDRIINTSSGPRSYKGKILKLRPDKENYLLVTLNKIGKPETLKVHRMVVKAFLTSWDNNLEVNHKNLNRQDNNINNLEMCTTQENNKHAIKYGHKGTSVKAENIITKETNYYNSLAEASRHLNIRADSISRVVRGIRKTTNDYTFSRTIPK